MIVTLKETNTVPLDQLLSGFLANGRLPQVISQSHLSANDKGNHNMKPGSVQRSLTFTLRLRKIPENVGFSFSFMITRKVFRVITREDMYKRS